MNAESAAVHLGDLAGRMPDSLVRFGAALEAVDRLECGWPYFLEKPWKWADEYAAWHAAGKPSRGDGDPFAAFEAAIDRMTVYGDLTPATDGG